ncbi:hypothetical protein [Palaeococcus sp. (in: euryarchaeotes)]
MNEYYIIMSIGGVLTLLGIVFTSILFMKLEKYEVQGKMALLGAVIGGILISMGFIGGMMSSSKEVENILIVLLLTGPGFMMYSFSIGGFLALTKRFVFQFLAILASFVVLYNHFDHIMGLLYVGTLLALFVIMNTILFLPGLSSSTKTPTLISSWLLVGYSWLRGFIHKETLDILSILILSLYLGAVVLWLYSLIDIYRHLR